MQTRVRLFQAGDLPGKNLRVNVKKVKRLVSACQGLQAFGYTHKPPEVGNNAIAIQYCNDNGVTINLSANNLRHADELADLNIGPVVVTLPQDSSGKGVFTPNGRRVVVCPAELGKITCATCGGSKGPLCYRADREFIVGFLAHGYARNKVSEMTQND
jgi:hypothetical protein